MAVPTGLGEGGDMELVVLILRASEVSTDSGSGFKTSQKRHLTGK